MAGAPNDVSYKTNTQMPNISIHCFPKDIAVWPKWTRFDRQNRGDFTLQCRRPSAPKAPVTKTCQLKGMLIKEPVPTPHTIVRHPLRLTFRKPRMMNSLLLFI